MGKLQRLEPSLRDIVKDIEKGNYLIPKFQRDFVWKAPDVCSLGDSIIKGYPISQMLTMPENGNLTIPSSSLRTHGAVANNEKKGHYLLDGQQRMTAIAKIFLGFDDKKEYYFDLLSALCDKFPDDDIPNIKSIKNELNKGGKSEINTEILCKDFSRSSNGDEKSSRQDFRFISGRKIIEGKFSFSISKFIKIFENDVDEETYEKYTNYLGTVIGDIGNYIIPFTTIGADAELDLIIRVFEKVNTTGMKLTIFDLVNAKSFEVQEEKYEMGLSEYLSNNINYLLHHNKELSEEGISDFFGKEKNKGNNNFTYSNFARFTRIIFATEFLMQNKLPAITQQKILKKDSLFWFEKWNQYNETILKYISWLENEGILRLGSKAFLEYMGAIICMKPDMLNNLAFLTEIKKYNFYISFQEQGFSKSNLQTVMDFLKFANHLESSNQTDKHEFKHKIRQSLTFDKGDILKIKYKSKLFNVASYILFKEHHKGYFTVDLYGNTINDYSLAHMDAHHAIPKAIAKNSNPDIVDSLANIVMVDSRGNRFEIKDKKPNIYIDEIKKIHTDSAFENIIKQNIFEEFLHYGTKPIEDILDKRAEKIAEILEDYFKTNYASKKVKD